MKTNNKTLFTGGSGLLGSEMKKIATDFLYPTRIELDITDPGSIEKFLKKNNVSKIIHAAAFTSPPKVEEDPTEAIEVNIVGTANIVQACIAHDITLVYISTDYVFDGSKGMYTEDDHLMPVNKYAWSKLGGEAAVHMYSKSLILRTTFGENEFPFPKAFEDQWTSRESVSRIAPMLLEAINTNSTGVIHVGGNRKSVLEYAKNVSPEKEIGTLSRNDVDVPIPKDTSLDVRKFHSLINGK